MDNLSRDNEQKHHEATGPAKQAYRPSQAGRQAGPAKQAGNIARGPRNSAWRLAKVMKTIKVFLDIVTTLLGTKHTKQIIIK